MKCFNCYSEFHPTLSKPICSNCGFCYYCRDFTCFHHDKYWMIFIVLVSAVVHQQNMTAFNYWLMLTDFIAVDCGWSVYVVDLKYLCVWRRNIALLHRGFKPSVQIVVPIILWFPNVGDSNVASFIKWRHMRYYARRRITFPIHIFSQSFIHIFGESVCSCD